MSLEQKKPESKASEKVKQVEKQPQRQYSLMVGLIGCFGGLFIQLVIGSMYQWGIINLYVTSYYRLTDDQSLTLESTAVAFPLLFIMIGAMMRLGIFLSSISHPLIVLVACKTLEAISMFVASYMPNIFLFILFYGFFFGVFAGTCFMLPIVECNKYMVGMKMVVNGIILIGTGSGSVVFGMFSYQYLNPTDIHPLQGYYLGTPELEAIALKVPVLIRWLSMLYLIIGYLGILLVSPVILRNGEKEKKRLEAEKLAQQAIQNNQPQTSVIPSQTHQLQNTEKKQQNPNQQVQMDNSNLQINQANTLQPMNKPRQFQNPAGTSQQRIMTKNLTNTPVIQKPSISPVPTINSAQSILAAAKSRVFWISSFIFLLGGTGCFMMNGNYKTYVKNQIKDDQFLTIIGVIGGIGNGCSRILWNYLFSRTGYKTTLLTIFTLAILVYSTIRFTVHIPGLYLFEIFIINCCLGGFLVSTPTSALCIYGPSTGANIYGILWDMFGLSNLLGYIYVSQLSTVIGFDNVIYICLGMSTLAVPIVICTKFQGPWQNDTSQLQFFVTSELEKQKAIEKQIPPLSGQPQKDSILEQERNKALQQNPTSPLFIELKVSNTYNNKESTKEGNDNIDGQTEEKLNQSPKDNKWKKNRLEPIKLEPKQNDKN